VLSKKNTRYSMTIYPILFNRKKKVKGYTATILL